ncbi:MAG: ATP-binding cassette domain-containing protein [Gammaproteobacteria bacterium]|nr:ATP-binding cassette domain-containing protein [Gammaproteobacteria bacterium]
MNEKQTAIQIKQLEFSWKENLPLTLNIEKLDIQNGERVFIKGASGSGKSTLLSLLGGVLLPQKGNVEILGQKINNLNGTARDIFRSNHIGFIFQMFNLLPYLSVIENVTLPLHFSDQRKHRVLKNSNIKKEAMRLLSHLDLTDKNILSRSTHELSVGQQQRVAAARALIGSPEIVIADEPTSSLDTDRRDAFIDLLVNECNENKSTLIFVSHDQTLEHHFDRSISLNSINQASLIEQNKV